MLLPTAGAAHVDRRLAAVAHKVGSGADRAALPGGPRPVRPDEAEARRLAAAEARQVDVHTRDAGPHRHRRRRRIGRPGRRPRPRDRGRPGRRRAQSRRIHRVTRRAPVDGARGDRPPLPRRRPQHRPIRGRAAGEAPPSDHQRAPPRRRHRTLRHHPGADQRGTSEVVVHPPGHPGDHPPDPRPERPHPGRRLRGPGPARRPGRPNATAPASTPGAPDPPGAATRTTASPTTAAARPAPDNIAPLCRTTSPIQDPRRMDATGSSDPAPTCGRSPDGYWFHRRRASAPPTSDDRRAHVERRAERDHRSHQDVDRALLGAGGHHY